MAAHLEKCKHFDHCVPSEQFRYCCVVRSDERSSDSYGTSTDNAHKNMEDEIDE